MFWGVVITSMVVAMLVGPIMLMKPSVSQKRLAAKRQKALEMGFRVHMVPIPEGAIVDFPSRLISMYCLPWDKNTQLHDSWLLIKKGYTHEIHAAGFWDWSHKRGEGRGVTTILGKLDELPTSAVAVESSTQGLCCYWLEKGDEQQVDQLLSWLKQSAATLSQN